MGVSLSSTATMDIMCKGLLKLSVGRVTGMSAPYPNAYPHHALYRISTMLLTRSVKIEMTRYQFLFGLFSLKGGYRGGLTIAHGSSVTVQCENPANNLPVQMGIEFYAHVICKEKKS